jgi:hypothetical protein
LATWQGKLQFALVQCELLPMTGPTRIAPLTQRAFRPQDRRAWEKSRQGMHLECARARGDHGDVSAGPAVDPLALERGMFREAKLPALIPPPAWQKNGLRTPCRAVAWAAEGASWANADGEEKAMNEDKFNMSLRKFLKQVGVTSQREIERLVRDRRMDRGTLKVKIVLTAAGTDLSHTVEGELDLG